MCNTLNIKALELYCNIKKWNIELDTLNNNFTSLCSTLHFYTISRPNSLIFRQNFFEKSSNGKSWVKKKTEFHGQLRTVSCERVLVQYYVPAVRIQITATPYMKQDLAVAYGIVLDDGGFGKAVRFQTQLVSDTVVALVKVDVKDTAV